MTLDQLVLESLKDRSMTTSEIASAIGKPVAAANSVLTAMLKRGQLDLCKIDSGLSWKIGTGNSDKPPKQPKLEKLTPKAKKEEAGKSRLWVRDGSGGGKFVYSDLECEAAEAAAESNGEIVTFAEET